tara:strand:- start:727 stop:1005 length:279 start_codon:yes stop_codon:yes gene_type:complete
MTKIYIIKSKDIIIGVYDDLNLFKQVSGESTEIPKFPKNESSIIFGKYMIERVKLNETFIKPNQIIYKGKDFNLNNLEDELPLLDLSDPTFL